MDSLDHPLSSEYALHDLVFQPQNKTQESPIGPCPDGAQACPKACFLYLLTVKDSSSFPATSANSGYGKELILVPQHQSPGHWQDLALGLEGGGEGEELLEMSLTTACKEDRVWRGLLQPQKCIKAML